MASNVTEKDLKREGPTMASIEKLGEHRWRARWRNPDGRQRAKTFPTKRAASNYLAVVGTSMQAGDYLDPAASRAKVADFAPKWLAAQGHLKASTRATYEHMLTKHVLPRWGTTPLGKVTHEDVAAWVSDLSAAGLSAATVRYAFRVLSMLLDFAVRAKRVRQNAAAGVKLPRAASAEKRYLTHQEVARLADAAGDRRAVVLVLAYCGLRWGELAALRVGRVDLLRRRIRVEEAVSEVRGRLVWGSPKSHQVRSVPIPRFLVDELAVQVAGKGADELVFTAGRGGVLRNLNFRRDVFDPAAKIAGLEGLTPHELRHTAASLAVSAGANVKAVQRMLGHKSAAMTLDVYSGLFDDDLDGVADRLDAYARVYSMCTDADVVKLPETGSSR